jgi:hypothetical protein
LAPAIAFWEDSLPDPLLGNNSILRTPGGQANAIDLTPEGLKNASEI